jgi:glycosyltransferase involved in cell wall biosynthesis
MSATHEPAVWFPTIRANTGADVFVQRLRDALVAKGVRAEITWLPHRAEYCSWTAAVPQSPSWANVVHVNSWLPRRFWPKKLPAVVTVFHLVHDPAYRPYRSFFQAVYHELLIRRREWLAIRDADTVTTGADYVKRTITEFSGREQIAVIPNWVDGDKFAPPDNVAVERGSGTFRLFMAGSHSRRKGFDLLPSFVQALGSGFEIRYAGGKTRGISPIPGVIELGRIDEEALIREYKACDAVVSLSRYEGFGYTAAEAMACGKPFLGFDTSALPEVVAPGCGELVPLDDVEALAAVAHRLRAATMVERQAWSDGGRSLALAKFSQANVDKYVEIYLSLVA